MVILEHFAPRRLENVGLSYNHFGVYKMPGYNLVVNALASLAPEYL
jgi:hypothetical protein